MVPHLSSSTHGRVGDRPIVAPIRTADKSLQLTMSNEYDTSMQSAYAHDSPISPLSTAPSWRPERASTQSAFSAETCNGPHTPKAESISLPKLEDVDEGEDLGRERFFGSENARANESGNAGLKGVTSSLGVDGKNEGIWWEDLVSPCHCFMGVREHRL